MINIFLILHFCSTVLGINAKVIGNLIFRIFITDNFDYTIILKIIMTYFQ